MKNYCLQYQDQSGNERMLFIFAKSLQDAITHAGLTNFEVTELEYNTNETSEIIYPIPERVYHEN
jgi:hypothetical protein